MRDMYISEEKQNDGEIQITKLCETAKEFNLMVPSLFNFEDAKLCEIDINPDRTGCITLDGYGDVYEFCFSLIKSLDMKVWPLEPIYVFGFTVSEKEEGDPRQKGIHLTFDGADINICTAGLKIRKKGTAYSFSMIPPLNENQMAEITAAPRKPITFDEDCPETTEETAEGFREARKRKPYKGFY